MPPPDRPQCLREAGATRRPGFRLGHVCGRHHRQQRQTRVGVPGDGLGRAGAEGAARIDGDHHAVQGLNDETIEAGGAGGACLTWRGHEPVHAFGLQATAW